MGDFEELRKKAEEMGLFKVKPAFFAAHLGHILLLEAVAFYILSYFGVGWIPLLVASLVMTTAQVRLPLF